MAAARVHTIRRLDPAGSLMYRQRPISKPVRSAAVVRPPSGLLLAASRIRIWAAAQRQSLWRSEWRIPARLPAGACESAIGFPSAIGESAPAGSRQLRTRHVQRAALSPWPVGELARPAGFEPAA